MLENKFCLFPAESACFDTPEGWWVGGVRYCDIKANSVQLQLPTGTKLSDCFDTPEGWWVGGWWWCWVL